MCPDMYPENMPLDCGDEAKARREREHRETYKALILDASRIAVRGGLLSAAYEDFVIDYLDKIVDELSDDDFDYLAEHGRIRAGAVNPDIASKLLSAARSLLMDKTLTAMDRDNLTAYMEVLEEQARACGIEPEAGNEIDQLRARIFKAADVLDAMDPEDARMPEYQRLYATLWEKYRELEKQGG
ncbi:hypothetical protein D3C81_837500 [compost metagenome]